MVLPARHHGGIHSTRAKTASKIRWWGEIPIFNRGIYIDMAIDKYAISSRVIFFLCHVCLLEGSSFFCFCRWFRKTTHIYIYIYIYTWRWVEVFSWPNVGRCHALNKRNLRVERAGATGLGELESHRGWHYPVMWGLLQTIRMPMKQPVFQCLPLFQVRLPLAPSLARDVDTALEAMNQQAWSLCASKVWGILGLQPWKLTRLAGKSTCLL